MTYAQFHLAFTIPPFLALALLQPRPLAGIGAREALRWLAAIAAIAFVYTTPWDNYLVYRDVWGYPEGAVLATIGYVPVEEYFFFLIQPGIVGLYYFLLRGRGWLPSEPRPMPIAFRTAGVAAWAALTLIGVGLLLHPSDHALYLGLILAWAPPVMAGLWWIGADKIWADRRRVAVAIAVPTLYLWVIDRTAIRLGIWDIREATKLGVDPFGLPIEEATFFLLTTALCVSGLALFLPSPARR